MKLEEIEKIVELVKEGKMDTVQAILQHYEYKGENQNETLQKSKSRDNVNAQSPTAQDNKAISLPDNLPPGTIALKPDDDGGWCIAHYAGFYPHPFVVHTMDKYGNLFWGHYFKTEQKMLKYFTACC